MSLWNAIPSRHDKEEWKRELVPSHKEEKKPTTKVRWEPAKWFHIIFFPSTARFNPPSIKNSIRNSILRITNQFFWERKVSLRNPRVKPSTRKISVGHRKKKCQIPSETLRCIQNTLWQRNVKYIKAPGSCHDQHRNCCR